MNILVINCGSSSVKYRSFSMNGERVLAEGTVERIGEDASSFVHARRTGSGTLERRTEPVSVSDHRDAFRLIQAAFSERGGVAEGMLIEGIGHRVVHGGEYFSDPTVIDEDVTARIRELEPLAPLHNPANLLGIEAAREIFPGRPQVAVFDTAFHQSMPAHAFRYAVPERFYAEHRVRRYGFHGTSHHYVAKEAARYLGRPLSELNLITLHLGNGASATAIREGRSVDTSMGFTPLEGLIMGTRSGDIDPAFHAFLGRQGFSFEEVDDLLNHQSGLKGICGTNDMREIGLGAKAGIPALSMAVDMFCYRIRKYIGAYAAVLGRIDCLVFTGGIGENAVFIRQQCCENLDFLGLGVDEERNRNCSGEVSEIQMNDGPVKVLVVKTNEELEIARQTAETIQAGAVRRRV